MSQDDKTVTQYIYPKFLSCDSVANKDFRVAFLGTLASKKSWTDQSTRLVLYLQRHIEVLSDIYIYSKASQVNNLLGNNYKQ